MRTASHRSAKGNQQSGFTLLELLVVIGIIGVLSYLGLTSFYVYRADAAYSVAETVLRNTRIAAEASINDLDNPPPAVSAVQLAPGPIQDANARAYLPGMQLPRNVRLTADYDPACLDSSCQSDFLEVKHCLGKEYVQWVRFGDGVEVDMRHLDGPGCG